MADYTRNKNLWRRVVGYGAQPRPTTTTVIDPKTLQPQEINLQNVIRDRDFFFIQAQNNSSLVYGEYEEGLVAFNYSDSTIQTINFSNTFSGPPIVVLTIDQDNTTTNVNPYGISYSASSITFGVSAPFYGNLRYRAVYSPTYPCTVNSVFSSSLLLSAKNVNFNDVYFEVLDSSYDAIPSGPTFLYQTAWDSSALNSSDIYIENVSVTNTNVSSSLSAPFSKEIHFIAIV